MNKLENDSPQGKYFFHTLSGSNYTLMIEDDGKRWIQRFSDNTLRKDSQKIYLLKIISLEVGKQGYLLLEPLCAGNSTLRITTPITKIYQ